MKNYEKYADELRKYEVEELCNKFIKPNILKKDNCSGINCTACSMRMMLWLLEDCEESEVDWNKIKVDTQLLVRNYKNGDWSKRYFAKYDDGKVYAWYNGRTSWNETSVYAWNYAKLAGDEKEYKESEIDWNKVEVDTPILVRYSEKGMWIKRNFARYKNGVVYAWHGGGTGQTESDMTPWNYAKLAESERKDNISESNANNRR